MKHDPKFAADQLDALDTATDPEAAHANADDILLANVDPIIAEAYKRVVGRCAWWGTA